MMFFNLLFPIFFIFPIGIFVSAQSINPILTPTPELIITEVNYNTPEYVEVLNIGPSIDVTQIRYFEGAGEKSIQTVSNPIVNTNDIFVIVNNSNLPAFNTKFNSYSGPIFTTTARLNNTGDFVSLQLGEDVIDSFTYSTTVASGNVFNIDQNDVVTESAYSVGSVGFDVPISLNTRTLTRSLTSSEEVSIRSTCDVSPAQIVGTIDITFVLDSDGLHNCGVIGTSLGGLDSNEVIYNFLIETISQEEESMSTPPALTEEESIPTPPLLREEEPIPTLPPLTEKISKPIIIENSSKAISINSKNYKIRSRKNVIVGVFKPYVKLFNRKIYYPEDIKGNYFLGDESDEVLKLQNFLVKNSFLINGSYISKKYDRATANAVMEYKNINRESILEPMGLNIATSMLDTTTREHINFIRKKDFENMISKILKTEIKMTLLKIN